jgi:hypothetical protein
MIQSLRNKTEIQAGTFFGGWTAFVQPRVANLKKNEEGRMQNEEWETGARRWAVGRTLAWQKWRSRRARGQRLQRLGVVAVGRRPVTRVEHQSTAEARLANKHTREEKIRNPRNEIRNSRQRPAQEVEPRNMRNWTLGGSIEGNRW